MDGTNKLINFLLLGQGSEFQKPLGLSGPVWLRLLHSIDWSELKKQKAQLALIRSVGTNCESNPETEKTFMEALSGTIHLIDVLQNEASKLLGQVMVYNLVNCEVTTEYEHGAQITVPGVYDAADGNVDVIDSVNVSGLGNIEQRYIELFGTNEQIRVCQLCQERAVPTLSENDVEPQTCAECK